MKNDYTLQKTIKALDDLARGINPFTGEELPETDIVNDIRVSRYLFTALGILRENQGIKRLRSSEYVSDYETRELVPVLNMSTTKRIRLSMRSIRSWLMERKML